MRPDRNRAVRGSAHGYNFQWALDNVLSAALERLETLKLSFINFVPPDTMDRLRDTCARIDAVLSTPRFARLAKFDLVLFTPADEADRFREGIAACFPDARARGVLDLKVC